MFYIPLLFCQMLVGFYFGSSFTHLTYERARWAMFFKRIHSPSDCTAEKYEFLGEY